MGNSISHFIGGAQKLLAPFVDLCGPRNNLAFASGPWSRQRVPFFLRVVPCKQRGIVLKYVADSDRGIREACYGALTCHDA